MSLLPINPINQFLPGTYEESYLNATPNYSSVLKTDAVQAFWDNPTTSIWRMGDIIKSQYDSLGKKARLMSSEEAEQKYSELGLKFNSPVYEAEAEIMATRKQEEIQRQYLQSKAKYDFLSFQSAGRFGTSLAVSMIDPINIASAFLPVADVLPSLKAYRLARAAGSSAKVGMDLATGAVEGAVGAAMLEPLMLAANSMDQGDYTMADSLNNVFLGAVMGAGLHRGVGFLDNRISAKRTAREAQFKTLLNEVSNGKSGSTIAQVLAEADPVKKLTNLAPEHIINPLDEHINAVHDKASGTWKVRFNDDGKLGTLEGVGKTKEAALRMLQEDYAYKLEHPELYGKLFAPETFVDAAPEKAPGAVLYHGTNKGDAIRQEGFKIGSKEDSPYVGDNWVEGVYLSRKKEAFDDGEILEGASEVLHVAYDNPKGLLKTKRENLPKLLKRYGIDEMDDNAPRLLKEKLQEKGYDGIDIGDEVVVFNPSQLKVLAGDLDSHIDRVAGHVSDKLAVRMPERPDTYVPKPEEIIADAEARLKAIDAPESEAQLREQLKERRVELEKTLEEKRQERVVVLKDIAELEKTADQQESTKNNSTIKFTRQDIAKLNNKGLKSFEHKHSQHADIKAKDLAEAKANFEKIKTDGFKSNYTNVIPVTKGEPKNVIDKTYGTKQGKLYYIVPDKQIDTSGRGGKIKDGWQPAETGIVEIRYDNQPIAEALIEKALGADDALRKAITEKYPELFNKKVLAAMDALKTAGKADSDVSEIRSQLNKKLNQINQDLSAIKKEIKSLNKNNIDNTVKNLLDAEREALQRRISNMSLELMEPEKTVDDLDDALNKVANDKETLTSSPDLVYNKNERLKLKEQPVEIDTLKTELADELKAVEDLKAKLGLDDETLAKFDYDEKLNRSELAALDEELNKMDKFKNDFKTFVDCRKGEYDS